MSKIHLNLFNVMQKNLIDCVNEYLSSEYTEEDNKPTPVSLRLPKNLKDFFEFLAEKTNNSFGGIVANILEKAKEETIAKYKETIVAIEDKFESQLKNFLQIMSDHGIDHNDIPALLSGITGMEIKRSDLINQKKFINILTKENQHKICKLFNYSYAWFNNDLLSYGEYSYSMNFDNDGIHKFINLLIATFYFDETTTSCSVNFFVANKDIVNNIKENNYPNTIERVVIYIEAERNINNVKFSTYHHCGSIDINQENSRKKLIQLVKTLIMLSKPSHNIVTYPNAFLLSKSEVIKIMKNEVAISSLFNGKRPEFFDYMNDLEDIDTSSTLSENETDTPMLEHFLRKDVLSKILSYAEEKKLDTQISVDEELSTTMGMSQKNLIKYLCLYTCRGKNKNMLTYDDDKNCHIAINIVKENLALLESLDQLQKYI